MSEGEGGGGRGGEGEKGRGEKGRKEKEKRDEESRDGWEQIMSNKQRMLDSVTSSLNQSISRSINHQKRLIHP